MMALLEAGCVMDLEAREWQCWGTFVPPRRMNQNIPKYKKRLRPHFILDPNKQKTKQKRWRCGSHLSPSRHPQKTLFKAGKKMPGHDIFWFCLGPQLDSQLALEQNWALSGSALEQTRSKKTVWGCCQSPDMEQKPGVYSQIFAFNTENLSASWNALVF